MARCGAWAKWVLGVLIAVGVCMGMVKQARAEEINGVEYSGNLAFILEGTKVAKILSSHTEDGQYYRIETVKHIAYNSHINHNSSLAALTSLSIPNGVTTIGCSVYARDFKGCTGLTDLSLPASMTTWMGETFAECTALQNLELAEGLKKLGRHTFSGCTALPSVRIPSTLTDWGLDVFSGCAGLTNVTLPEGLASVGEGAFSDCYRLETIAFPSSLKTLKERAFAGCAALSAVDFGGVVTIGGKAFAGCTGLKELAFSEEVRKIGTGAFSGSGLETVTLPAWIEEVEPGAFSVVPLKTLRFDNTNGVFLGRFSKGALRMLYLGANARGVTAELLADCQSLAAVLVDPENPEYAADGAGALYDKNFTRLIKYPACAAAAAYTVPATVRTVDAKAFANATALRELVFQGPLTGIGEDAFDGCAALERVVFPDRVATFGAGAFRACPSLAMLRFEGTGVAVPAFGAEQFLYAKPTVGIVKTEWSRWKATLTKLGLKHEWIEDAGQQALELGESNREFTADAASGEVLQVTANVAWTAKSSATWLTVKTASGTGNGKITYDVAANGGSVARTATITVEGGALTQTFTVTQEGNVVAALVLGASERSFTADAANSKELGVSASAGVSWTAKSSATWLTVKTTGGTGIGKIVYSVAANTGTGTRTATITVTGGGTTRTFTVTQAGKSGGGTAAALTLAASSRTFTADAASSKEVGVTANVSWTAKSSASWLTVKTTSGKGNGKIVYNVAANTGTGSRTAKITVAGGGLSRIFTVTQNGKGAKSKAVRSKKAAAEETARATVTTSDGSDGRAVADGDEGTGWSPAGTAGAWVALTFDDARTVDAVEVVGDRLPSGMRVLVSEDGDTWSEEGGEKVQYLWVILPGEGEVPTVREIVTEP